MPATKKPAFRFANLVLGHFAPSLAGMIRGVSTGGWRLARIGARFLAAAGLNAVIARLALTAQPWRTRPLRLLRQWFPDQAENRLHPIRANLVATIGA